MLIQRLLIPEVDSDHSFANFTAEGNSSLLANLQSLQPESAAFQDSRWLYGLSGSGKSHLLYALRHSWQSQAHNVALLRLLDTRPHFHELVDFVIEHGNDYDMLLVDDAQLIVGDARLERALYRLVNCALAQDKPMLMSGDRPSSKLAWTMNDVRTRMKLFPELELRALTGAAVEPIAENYAQSLGLFLSATSWNYIRRDYPRDMHKIYKLINILAHKNAISKSSPSVQQIKAVVEQL